MMDGSLVCNNPNATVSVSTQCTNSSDTNSEPTCTTTMLFGDPPTELEIPTPPDVPAGTD